MNYLLFTGAFLASARDGFCQVRYTITIMLQQICCITAGIS